MTLARRNYSLPDIPRSQLRAEWRFTDYGDTANVRDWSGGARHMAPVNSIWSTAGILFNGSSAYLGAVGAGVATFSSTTTFSVIAALRATGTSGTVIGPTGTGGIQVLVDSNSKFTVNKANTAVVGSGNTIMGNRWCVCGVSYDGTTIRFYRDGMADGATTASQTFTVLNSYIGKRNNTGTEFFTGEIAYLLAYDRVLTQPEHQFAAQNIARHIGLLPPGKLIRPWAFAVAAPTGSLFAHPGMDGGFGTSKYPSASAMKGGMNG